MTAVKDDRFYVVSDGEGTLFKLVFTKMLSDRGDRGFPAIQYQEF